MKMILLAIVFMACAPQMVAGAGPENQLTQAPACAGVDKATCDEENSVQNNEEASLLQVNIGAHSQEDETSGKMIPLPEIQESDLQEFAGAEARCTPVHKPGDHVVELDVDRTTRRFWLHVPAHVNASDGLPAVVAIHGYSANPFYYMLQTGTQRHDDDQPFNKSNPSAAKGSFEFLQAGFKWLFALPFGTASKDSPLCCPEGVSEEECKTGKYLDKINPCDWKMEKDIPFIKAVTEYLIVRMCANPDALFATGFSRGSMMTNRVGCDLADTFRGIAAFSGTLSGAGGDGCKPARPISVIQFCDPSDWVCNGSIKSTIHTWAEKNGCSNETVETYTSRTTHCQKWTGCTDNVFVEECLLTGMVHNYPGHVRPAPNTGPCVIGPGEDWGFQPATNLDGMRYFMDRFSTLLPDVAARACGLTTADERAALSM